MEKLLSKEFIEKVENDIGAYNAGIIINKVVQANKDNYAFQKESPTFRDRKYMQNIVCNYVNRFKIKNKYPSSSFKKI